MDQLQNNICTVSQCAITGAAAFCLGIKDAIVLINGSKFCCIQMLHHLERCFQESVKDRVFCTDIQENNLIFGNEKNIKNQLELIKTVSTPSVIFLANNCAASLIGDDLEGIAVSCGFQCPVVTLDSGGLKGNFREGYISAAKNFFNNIDVEESVITEDNTINIIGVTEEYYNTVADLEEVKSLLTKFGIKVLNYISYNMDMKNILRLKKARLNVVLHEELGLELAELLKEQWQIPYLNMLPPYGLLGSKNWILTIAQTLRMHINVISGIENYFKIAWNQQEKYLDKLRKYHGDIWIHNIKIACAYSTALGIAEALRCELVNYCTMDTYIYGYMGKIDNKIQYYNIYRQLEVNKKDSMYDKGIFVFSSFHERSFWKVKSGRYSGYCCIANPAFDFASFGPYMGIRGTKHLLEILWQYFIDSSRLLEE